eukprot:scaffold55881_cov37-Prasinocladus_malaysianus.AAC.1
MQRRSDCHTAGWTCKYKATFNLLLCHQAILKLIVRGGYQLLLFASFTVMELHRSSGRMMAGNPITGLLCVVTDLNSCTRTVRVVAGTGAYGPVKWATAGFS